jgi:hypothetical protein
MVLEVMRLEQELMEAVDEVSVAFAVELAAKSELQRAEQEVDEYLAGIVVEAEYDARVGKSGPLAELAKTSEAYKAAIVQLKSQAMRHDDAGLVEQAGVLRGRLMNAQIDYERAKNRFAAQKIRAELRASLLRALAG